MSKLKRYLVFACDQYNPAGGWNDFSESFDTVAEAKEEFMKLSHYDFIWIIDSETGEDLA